MAITTLRPDSVISGASNVTITGAANIWTALNDNSDSSYVVKAAGVAGTADMVTGFGSTPIAADKRVRRVRLRARTSSTTAAARCAFFLGTNVTQKNYFARATQIAGVVSATTAVGAWLTASPDGAAWDQSRVDALRIKFREYKDSTDRSTVYELYLDVDIESQPTVSGISSPSGTISSTSAPTVEWLYSDPEAGAQAFYQVKVFTAAQYGAVGFDPETSEATWDSGQVASSDTATVVSALLINGAYRCYIRAAKSINGTPFWSAWAFSVFTQSCTPPTTPAIDAAFDELTGGVEFTLTGANPVGFASQYFELQKSLDDATWVDTRNGAAIVPDAAYVGTETDYENLRDAVTYYRVRAVGVQGENYVTSDWSVVQQIYVSNDGLWWLKVLDDHTLNVSGVRVQGPLEIEVLEPNVVTRPIGRSRPVVVSGLVQGKDGQFVIKAVSDDEWALLEPALLAQSKILVQDPFGAQKYIRVISRSCTYEAFGAARVRTVTVAYVEVEA